MVKTCKPTCMSRKTYKYPELIVWHRNSTSSTWNQESYLDMTSYEEPRQKLILKYLKLIFILTKANFKWKAGPKQAKSMVLMTSYYTESMGCQIVMTYSKYWQFNSNEFWRNVPPSCTWHKPWNLNHWKATQKKK